MLRIQIPICFVSRSKKAAKEDATYRKCPPRKCVMVRHIPREGTTSPRSTKESFHLTLASFAIIFESGLTSFSCLSTHCRLANFFQSIQHNNCRRNLKSNRAFPFIFSYSDSRQAPTLTNTQLRKPLHLSTEIKNCRPNNIRKMPYVSCSNGLSCSRV